MSYDKGIRDFHCYVFVTSLTVFLRPTESEESDLVKVLREGAFGYCSFLIRQN